MHPLSQPSTVVFQWRNDPACDHIDISTAPDIGEVIIHAKEWSEHVTETAYKGTLPLSVKAEGEWNTITVSSTKPLAEEVKVYAHCKKSFDQ